MNEIIKESITIIENNLHHKLNIDTIANKLGYSKFHFSKLFKKHTGFTVHNYINNRKLICAAKDILNGQKITVVAMNYGYDTHSGFGKAFIKKFGFTPNMLHAMRLAKELFSDTGGINMNYEVLYSQLNKELLKSYSHNELKCFYKAYDFILKAYKTKKRYSGEPYIVHPLNVAIMIEKMDLPLDTVILALLHEATAADFNSNEGEIISLFGQPSLDKIKAINTLNIEKDNINQLIKEYSNDIIMVKLADRLHNMKTLKHLSPTKWQEKANETMELFFPLAKAVNAEEMMLELEHLSLEYL